MSIEQVDDTGGVAEHIAQLQKDVLKIHGLITMSLIKDIDTTVTSVTGAARHVPMTIGMIGDFLCKLSGVLLMMQEKQKGEANADGAKE